MDLISGIAPNLKRVNVFRRYEPDNRTTPMRELRFPWQGFQIDTGAPKSIAKVDQLVLSRDDLMEWLVLTDTTKIRSLKHFEYAFPNAIESYSLLIFIT